MGVGSRWARNWKASKEATVSTNQFPLINIPKNFEFSYSVAFESKKMSLQMLKALN